MPQTIKPLSLGGVNGFLIHTDKGYVLIDTGIMNKRADLDRQLASAGCEPGNLQLAVLTHGDIDHAGNGAFLRTKYGAKIAMHRDDVGMVEQGNMGWNRKAKPDRYSFLFRLVGIFVKPGAFEKFSPDFTVEDGYDLSAYGFDARVIHLPGHSKGSIGILTSSGELICGDLLMNFRKPDLHMMIDNLAEANASVERLKGLAVSKVYPGHGGSFTLERFLRNRR